MDAVELTIQQKDILNYNGNVFVLASSGAAKTYTTISKIKKIKRESPNSRLLYITFTRKAKQDAIERIGDTNNVLVTNYHGLAYKTLCEHKEELQMSELGIVPESYAVNILEELFPSDDSKALHRKLNLIEMLKMNYIKIKGMEPLEKGVFIPFKEVMISQKKFMFSDLIYKVNEMFESGLIKPYVAKKLLRFDYIFIDEIQDTNNCQFKFVKNLMDLNTGASIMGTGDISQSIYRWRSAKPELCLHFINDYDAKVLPLTTNFRSQESIIDLGNAFLDIITEFPELRKPMDPFRPRGCNIKWYNYNSTDEQYQAVCTEIHRLIASGLEYSDIFILFRKNLSGTLFEKFAIRQNIPFKLLKGSLLERKEVKYFLGLLKFGSAINQENVQDEYIDYYLKTFAKELASDIGDKCYKVLYNYDNDMTFMQKLENIQRLKIEGIGSKRTVALISFYKALQQIINQYKIYEKSGDLDKLLQEYKQIILSFKSIKRVDRMRFRNLLESLDNFIDILKDLEGTIPERINTILIDYSSESNEEDKNRVLGMTVHKAKGTENKVCFIIDLTEFPATFSDDIEEEKRLLYVAITRAKDKLYLMSDSVDFKYLSVLKNFEHLDSNVSKETMESVMEGCCANV